MVFSIFELFDMVIMTVIIGFLFKDAFQMPRKHDVLDYYRNIGGFDWHNFWFACALIAPAILIHEFGHKFVAMGFGMQATFHAACSTSDLVAGNFLNSICVIQLAAVVMKFMGVGFIIFIPAFVSITGGATSLQHMLIAFAGPFVHLVFWLGTAYYLRNVKRRLPQKRAVFLYFFKQVNMFLFILNMLPIPGFDGFKVFLGLFRAFI